MQTPKIKYGYVVHNVFFEDYALANILARYVGFEVLTAVDMNVAIFRDIVLCIPCMNRHFRECITSTFRVENQLSKKLAS
jgi:hypothetical protein